MFDLLSAMNLPFFWKEDISETATSITFEEESSKHIVQVLRMKKGELLQVTNGKGIIVTAEITQDHKKHCEARIVELKKHEKRSGPNVSIGLSLLKNNSRFEWFLEKATEMGVSEVIPLLCERTERQHFRYDRMKNICVSAMLQSQQAWLPTLREPASLPSMYGPNQYQQKLIAHCIDGEKPGLTTFRHDASSQIILIGPEGDFTAEEVHLAIENGYLPVSLGQTRLRSETAGVVAAVLLLVM